MKKITLSLIIALTLSYSCIQTSKRASCEKYINDGWHIISSAQVGVDGKILSSRNVDVSAWFPSEIPSTVLASLVKNGEYADIYQDTNFIKIPKERFKHSWWYRKEFKADDSFANTNIVFEGINYKANIWLNGELIADTSSIEHPFMIFDLNITNYLKAENILAIEIFPAKRDALTVCFVDWNPESPDRNLGLWRGVKLIQNGKVSLKNVVVKSKIDKENYKWAKLTICADVVNNSSELVSGKLNYQIGNIKFSQSYTLEANETKQVIAKTDDFSELEIQEPKLWWPQNMGEPNLYNLHISAVIKNEPSCEKTIRFGIREVADFINEAGHRGYSVNGKKVLIRGGGWVDDLLLSDSDEKVKAQVAYTKHMGLNTIRLEGFWGKNQTLFDACDENGILLMIGLSCQWEWEAYCGRKEYDNFMSVDTPEDIEMISKAYHSQVEWLNNHPSVFVWVMGSDKLPLPEFEKKLSEYINNADGTRPLLNTCKTHTSEISGPSRVKMNGPYDYVTPKYWYIDTILGGAYGFNTETGPGPQIPPIESIRKMISKENEWPIDNKVWEHHLGRNEFQSLKKFLVAFNNRYGEATSLEDFAYRAQISNYESMRAMFESFAVNKFQSTGVIQWMLNSAWPEMYWQLYDWYLMPNGAFYGAKTACEPLNLAYNYQDKAIYLTNEYLKAFSNLKAEIKVLDINSKVLLYETVDIEIGENTSKKIFDLPVINGLSTVYFIDLKLKNEKGELVSDNFYWLSTKEDEHDFPNSYWVYTPLKSFADFKPLNNMQKLNIDTESNFYESGENTKVEVKLKNKSDKIAFFIEMQIVDDKSNNTVLPVFWSDNCVSLLPGEERVYTAEFATKNLNGEKPIFKMNFLNQKDK